MRNAYIHSFLAIIILLQSFAAVADAHQFHQSNNQHEIVADHIHEPAADIVANDVNQQDGSSIDCHHCCHCHSIGASVLPASSCHIGVINIPSVTFMYTDRYSSQPSGSLYRPPIV